MNRRMTDLAFCGGFCVSVGPEAILPSWAQIEPIADPSKPKRYSAFRLEIRPHGYSACIGKLVQIEQEPGKTLQLRRVAIDIGKGRIFLSRGRRPCKSDPVAQIDGLRDVVLGL